MRAVWKSVRRQSGYWGFRWFSQPPNKFVTPLMEKKLSPEASESTSPKHLSIFHRQLTSLTPTKPPSNHLFPGPPRVAYPTDEPPPVLPSGWDSWISRMWQAWCSWGGWSNTALRFISSCWLIMVETRGTLWLTMNICWLMMVESLIVGRNKTS